MTRTPASINAVILTALCAVLPFVFHTGPGSFTLPRAVLLQAGAGAAALILLLSNRRARFPAFPFLCAWLAIMALSAALSPFPLSGIRTLILFASCAALAYCAAAAFHAVKPLSVLCVTIVCAGSVMALHGIVQSHAPVLSALNPLRGRFTIIATAGSPAMLAGWLAPGLCLAFALSLRVRKLTARALLRAAFAAMALALFLCMSRSGWLAAAGGLLVTLVCMSASRAARLRDAAAGLAVCLVLALALAGAREAASRTILKYTQAPPAAAVLAQAAGPGSKSDSIRLRLFLLRAARDMIARRPALGHGPDGFRMQYPETQAGLIKDPDTRARYEVLITNRVATHAHNEFAEAAVEGGAAGFAAFALLLIAGMRSVRRRVHNGERESETILVCGVAGALTAMLIQSGLEFTLHLPLIAALFWILFGAGCAQAPEDRGMAPLARGAGILAAAALLLSAPLPWLAVRDLARGVSLAEKGHFPEAAAALERAAALDPLNPDILHSRAGVRMAQGRTRDAVADLDRALTLSRGPAMFVARGIALRMAGRPGRAEADFRTAASVDPWRPEPWYHLAALASARGDTRSARDYCERALGLAPDFTPARLLLDELNADTPGPHD